MGEPCAANRVSIICIFLDEERFLAEAIASVLAQSCPDFELILVDDGSTDASSAIARDHAARDPQRIRYLEHPGHANRGMSASRNLGIAAATAEFVAFIDADDAWLPHKLDAQLAIMQGHPEVQLVCGALNYWYSWDGGTREDVVEQTGHRADCVLHPPETGLALYPLGEAHAVAPSDALVRRTLFAAVGMFEEEFPGLYEDQVFFSKVYMQVPIYCASQVFTNYRQHPDSCVHRTHAEGRYLEGRAKFIGWLAGWMEPRELPGKPRLMRALRREQWKLAHPFATRVINRLRRDWARLNGREPG